VGCDLMIVGHIILMIFVGSFRPVVVFVYLAFVVILITVVDFSNISQLKDKETLNLLLTYE